MLAHLMGAVVGAFIAVAVSIFGPIREGAIVPASIPAPQEAPSPREAPRILFVGDVMLGRRVETLANEYGASYPFRHVSDEVALADYAVANFEGTVSDPHVHTPDLTYRFSVSEDLFREVKGSGFDAISLANNHSLDYGVPAFLNTTRLCERYGIVCGGDASSPNLASTTVARIGGERVGFLYLVAIGDDPVDIESVRSLMDELRGASDFQVALVHWGVEYSRTHTLAQERLAKELVDDGADLVIGHHPHVVEDVALYRGKPVFYSLGNFVFDQYFSTDVMEGLGVTLTLENEYADYALTGYATMESRSAPYVMSTTSSSALYARVLQNVPGAELERGTFSVPR